MEKKISSRVLMMCASGRIPQSLLIEGRDGSLRDDSALYLAAAVLCESKDRPCGSCKHCRKVFAGIHPDVTVLFPKEKSIKVDEIRSLRKEAFIKPNEAASRVFVIQSADTMNDEAQNALLKLLEEPPETVGLILTASSRSRLLPTVRSRLMLLNVDAESDAGKLSLSPLSLALVSRVAEKDGYGILKTLSEITADRTAAATVFFDARTAFMQAIAAKNGGESHEETVRLTSSRLTADQLLRLCRICEEAVDRMNANANKNLSAVSLSAEINKILGI